MDTKYVLRITILIGCFSLVACMGQSAAKMTQVLLHLAAGDCAEIAHVHAGTAARTVEVFCNGTERVTEYQVSIQITDAGKGD